MNGNTTLQKRELNAYIRITVAQTLQEILADPDYGLELRKSFVNRLKKSVQSERTGKVIPFDKILRKYKK